MYSDVDEYSVEIKKMREYLCISLSISPPSWHNPHNACLQTRLQGEVEPSPPLSSLQPSPPFSLQSSLSLACSESLLLPDKR